VPQHGDDGRYSSVRRVLSSLVAYPGTTSPPPRTAAAGRASSCSHIDSGGARANMRGMRLPCGCVGFFYVGANIVKI